MIQSQKLVKKLIFMQKNILNKSIDKLNKTLEEKNWKRVYSWKDFEKEMSILGQMS